MREGNFPAGQIPGSALVRGSLIVQEYLPRGGIFKDIRMSRFAGIPCFRIAGFYQRTVKHTGEMHAVLRGCHADLLGPAVVGACVEHIDFVVIHHGGRGFDALAFPVQCGLQNGFRCGLGKIFAVEAGVCGSGGHTQLLDLHGMITGGKVQIQFTVENTYIGIDGPSAAPVVCGTENGIGFVLFKVQSVRGDCVTDGVGFPVAVGLIEQMHLAVYHNGGRRAVAILFAFAGKIQRQQGLKGPVFSVRGGGDTDPQTLVSRNDGGVIQEIPASEKYNSRILGEIVMGI